MSGLAPATEVADPPAEVVSTVVSMASKPVALDGSIRGTVRPFRGATVGSEPGFVLSGMGQHATVGRARVTGFLMPSRVEANASGTLTLRTRRGDLTLALEATPETSARPALSYRYTIRQGTGAYRDATGTGTATLGLPQGLPRGSAGNTSFSFLLQSDRTRG